MQMTTGLARRHIFAKFRPSSFQVSTGNELNQAIVNNEHADQNNDQLLVDTRGTHRIARTKIRNARNFLKASSRRTVKLQSLRAIQSLDCDSLIRRRRRQAINCGRPPWAGASNSSNKLQTDHDNHTFSQKDDEPFFTLSQSSSGCRHLIRRQTSRELAINLDNLHQSIFETDSSCKQQASEAAISIEQAKLAPTSKLIVINDKETSYTIQGE